MENNRTRLSRNIRWVRFVIWIPIIFFVWVLFDKLYKNEMDFENGVGLFVFLAVFSIVYYLLDQTKMIEFDSSFLYVTGKKTARQIPLKEVNDIKLTGLRVNNISLWYIGFRLENGETDSVIYMPNWLHGNMAEFQNLVKRANKNVEISNWSF